MSGTAIHRAKGHWWPIACPYHKLELLLNLKTEDRMVLLMMRHATVNQGYVPKSGESYQPDDLHCFSVQA